MGEERYKKLVNFILHYVADLDVPIKRHVHAHSSDPIGRNATYVSVSLTKIQVPDELLVSIQERLDFLAYDEVCLPCELIPLFKLKFI